MSNFIKKVTDFFKTKTEVAMVKNISVEEQYTAAALKIIQEIEKLRKRDVTARSDIKKFLALAGEKQIAKENKDAEILRIRKNNPVADVSTHVKLALLYKHSSEQYAKNAKELEDMLKSIAITVVALSDKRDDFSVRLELLRETEKAKAMGLSSVDEVIESAAFLDIDVETILSKVEVVHGPQNNQIIDNSKMEEYLTELEAK